MQLNTLHVGLPKTGTTFLQRQYFPKLAKYRYVSCDQKLPKEFSFVYKLNKKYDKFFKKTFSEKFKGLCSDVNVENIKNMHANLTKSDPRPLLLSCEGLVGVSAAPMRNNLEVSLLLKEALDIHRVVLVIRRQDKYSESLYRQLVFEENRFKKFVPPEEFVSCEANSRSIGSAIEMNWLAIYQNYTSLFGSSNVLCIPYELMEENLIFFIEKLNNFLEFTPSLDDDFFSIKERTLNKKSSFANNPNITFENFNVDILNRLLSEQSFNNSCLSELLDFDLSKYGYHN